MRGMPPAAHTQARIGIRSAPRTRATRADRRECVAKHLRQRGLLKQRLIDDRHRARVPNRAIASTARARKSFADLPFRYTNPGFCAFASRV